MKTCRSDVAVLLLTFVLSSLSLTNLVYGQSNPFSSSQPGYPKWSAFSGVKWENDKPIVRVKGRWYELVSFHGIPTEAILKKCKENDWPVQKRFTEDLVQIVRLMGNEIDKTTDLVLKDENGKLVTMKNVMMTEKNRSQCLSSAAADQNPFLSSVPGYPSWSAFSGVKWEDGRPIVQVEDQWYELVSFHGIPTKDILNHCKMNGWPVQMRFTEDLVQIVRLMGHKIDKTTDLVLKDENEKLVTMKNVKMTEENLDKIMFAGIAAGNPFFSGVPGYPNWSAFSGVKWEGDTPIVQVKSQWYELVSFHGIPTADILKHCEEHDWPVKMRFTEDLVQIVRLMGHEIDKTTDLVLKRDDGQVVTMNNVTMTESNRRRSESTRQLSDRLSPEDLAHDLEVFQQSLESQFSYLKANGVDYRSAIQAIAEEGTDGMESTQLAEELQKVMALFIDGHARVSASTAGFADGFLPFLIEPSGERFAAVRSDRTTLLDPEFPYVRAIDGIEMKRWLDATAQYVAKGSPQYMRSRGLRLLRSIQQFRGKLGVETGDTLTVELVSRDGRSSRLVTEKVADGSSAYGTWPPIGEPGILDGNVGYMRLRQMDGQAAALIQEWMPKFRDTDGLIVDVRGNPGGVRTPILELAAYLLSSDDAPRIANVAKYRLAEIFREDHLSRARYVHRESSPQFDDRQREAIRRFKATFAPQWEPPVEEFSEWHYLVLSKRPDDPRFVYGKPVAILLDEECFSATDIFLGAFKGWPRVTLIGQPSGGGSARSQSFRQPHSRVLIRCASMASFQPTGKLYDTNGVEPDVLVVRPPEYYVGGPDVVLEQALAVLKSAGTQQH